MARSGDTINAIWSLVNDPEKLKIRVKLLQDETAKHEAARAAAMDAGKKYAELERRAKDLDARDADLADHNNDLRRREEALAAAQSQLVQARADNAQREVELTNRSKVADSALQEALAKGRKTIEDERSRAAAEARDHAAELNRRESAVATLEHMIARREKDVADAEAALASKREALFAAQKAHEEKVAGLRKFIS
jgi:chromosome segregation ATPase